MWRQNCKTVFKPEATMTVDFFHEDKFKYCLSQNWDTLVKLITFGGISLK